MSKKKKIRYVRNTLPQAQAEIRPKKAKEKKVSLLPWIFPIVLVTAVCLSPMLKNSFTNWDDEYYVVQNALLRGPDWAGIFSKPVVSNYHPITVATLAFNYSMTQLDPSSYLITNLLLHLINTALVFYFIWLISGKKLWVAAFSAIVFGIHPMHVESVAWVSERKDVLYTLFFLLSLIKYWRFLNDGKNKDLIYCFAFFALSILSKPAAIILPFVLLLLDYWYSRKFTSRVIVEKIPFFLVSIIFAVLTFNIQSKTAIASLDFYPLWTRFFFATYSSMIYIVRFFVPYPLSAFHPFPQTKGMPLVMILSPVFMLALLALVWFKRKNKLLVFTFFFFMINLVLVLQFVSIGGALLSERYTYVPYIGLAFLTGMLLDKFSASVNRSLVWGIPAVILLAFCVITFQRTKVWKNSETLWTDTIKHFPDAPVPRTNRANYLISTSSTVKDKAKQNEMLQMALEDCNVALKANANHAKGYENRQNIYLRLNKDTLALADATSLIRLEPGNRLGYYTKGAVYQRLNRPDSALVWLNKCLEVNPNTDFALNNRGSILFNSYQKYNEALADFNKAIQLNPNSGDYYLNRSYCYYRLNQVDKAKADAAVAIQKNITVPENYRQLLKL
jgi:tetratricopeptide (TPR) repeat protein